MSKYPYFKLPSPDNPVFKPYVYVRLGCRKTHRVLDKQQIIALIDSVSDVCLCKKYIGDYLGVDFKKAKKTEITAVNRTKMTGFVYPLTLYFQGKSYEVPFILSDSISDVTPVILGQKGFFDHFKITFDLRNKEIEIV